MTDFPDLKLKALVSFPATVTGGVGIDVTKQNGSYRLNLDYNEFMPPLSVLSLPDVSHLNALFWNDLTGAYGLAAISAFTVGLRGYISGLQLVNNATDPNHSIDVGIGVARDAPTNTNDIIVLPTTKKLNAAWAAGSGNGGLDTGVSAISTWYHLYAIKRPDTGATDVLFSASPSAPAMPQSYTLYRRIRGSVLTDGSGNIIPFIQNDSIFKWAVPVKSFDGVPITSTAAFLRKLSTPLGLKVPAIIHARASTTSTPIATLFTDPAMVDTVPDPTFAQHFANSAFSPYAQLQIGTDVQSQIRARSNLSDANTQLTIVTEGWIDTGYI